MAKDFDDKKYFHALLEKSCQGTLVTPKELLRELVNSGYKNLYAGDISLDELKMIVDDLMDRKDIAETHRHNSENTTASAEIEEVEIDDEYNDEDD